MTVLRPEDYGATLGSTEHTEAFRRMFAEMTRSYRRDPGGDRLQMPVIIELSGTYTVSDSISFAAAVRTQGITFRGTGKRTSEIVMTGAKPLFVNPDTAMGVRFYDCSFRSTNPGASFLYSTSTGGAQDWGFTNVEWRGVWQYGIGLDGPDKSNCNSEWFFNNCHINGSYDVAWLWSGMTPTIAQQDQFLNFSLRDCKVEYDSGDALRFDKGGSIVVSGGSWIIKGKRADGKPSRFFHFPPGSHYDSVQSLLVEGVRFEPREAMNLIIESAWRGQITFLNCMDDAWAFKEYAKADDYAPHRYTNPGGVRYQGCQLTGRHRITQDVAPNRQSICYDQNARTVASRRSKSAFLDLRGAYASSIRITHRDDRDGIT
ncbi:glycosyl hydrolase family 28-related protein [Streptomyces xanthophaeus]